MYILVLFPTYFSPEIKGYSHCINLINVVSNLLFKPTIQNPPKTKKKKDKQLSINLRVSLIVFSKTDRFIAYNLVFQFVFLIFLEYEILTLLIIIIVFAYYR